MLKSLFPSVDWKTIEAVGFDLDGTLYDEITFITQVYLSISNHISTRIDINQEKCYSSLIQQWIEKGSSYNKIFSDFLTSHLLSEKDIEAITHECLTIFRKYEPVLELPERSKLILKAATQNHSTFIITDGSPGLQGAKIKALNIDKWIPAKNIIITGSFGNDHNKPSTESLKHLELLKKIKHKKNIVYFGDRNIDGAFAASAGFSFIPVNCMFPKLLS